MCFPCDKAISLWSRLSDKVKYQGFKKKKKNTKISGSDRGISVSKWQLVIFLSVCTCSAQLVTIIAPLTFTLSLTSPGFYVSAVQVFLKTRGKRRNCSL